MPLVIGGVVLMIAAGIFLVTGGLGNSGDVDLADLMTDAQFSGYDDGYGSLTELPVVDSDKKADLLDGIKDDDRRHHVEDIISSISCTADQTEGLSNGDSVEITISYDEDIAGDNGIEVSGRYKTVEVEGLSDLPQGVKDADDAVYNSSNGHFYRLVDPEGGIYWTSARTACEQQGGHLATVLDAEEEAFIESLIEERGRLFHYWLGATDENSEGSWYWITGERVPLRGEDGFQKWCGNQPNNTTAFEAVGQDYMEIQKTRGDQGPEEYMTWTDIGNSGEAAARFFGPPDYNETKYYGYICEWDPE